MPYYIYRMAPSAPLEKLAEFDAFPTASAHAKTLRAAPDSAAQAKIKVMFASTEQQAEELLRQVREPGPLGDE